MKAGAAKVDITPTLGIQLAGDIGRHRPAQRVLDPLYARALVLEQDGRQFCILSIDSLAIDTPWADELRRRSGMPPEALMIHVTQVHSAPSIGNHFCRDTCQLIPAEHSWLRGGDERYNEPALAGILKAINAARANLQPVALAAGRTLDGRVAFNRRFVMRDGTAICHPPNCDPKILHCEGPTDPEVGVLTLTGVDGKIVSTLLHHTCHPCHGYPTTDVSADWPGVWCDAIEKRWGGIPLVINGCCGNIHHNNHIDPAQVDTQQRMGELLAESALRVKLTPLDPTPFNWTRRYLPIPRREIPADLLASSEKMLRDHPQPPGIPKVPWDWVYSVGILDIADERKTHPTFPYEIQALRLGNFALLAVMGEPFVEFQLAIKRAAPFAHLQVAHMSNGYVGYLPTKRAFAGGGYETRTGRGSRLVPEAGEMVEAAAIALLKEL